MPARGGPRPKTATGASMNAWAFLLVGLVLGGAVGYALRTAVAPREEGGMPRGPADIMAGAANAGGADAANAGGADAGARQAGGETGGAPPGMDKTQMMPQVIEALAKYRNTLADDPTNVEANIGMGNLMFDSGKWDKAIEHYTAALRKDPNNGDVRVDRGIAYHEKGQNDLALADMKRVTRENPKHVNAWLNLGVVAGAMGDTKTNKSAWEMYLKLEPAGQHADAIRAELAKVK